MFSNYDNIKILVTLLKKNGINKIVISPGGTNIPLIQAVQNDSFFTCYSIVDERSAVYFAIGIYLQTGEPIALSCTSAQATRNYVPGLTEAFYKRVPILALTMEKHPRFVYQEYMQAPNQISLPEDCVKRTFELPFISDYNDILHSTRIINEAIIEMTKNGFGPVQLAIPWLDFPRKYETNNIKKIDFYEIEDEWNIELNDRKILIVIGEHRPFEAELLSAINKFCENYDVAVYTNHLSNFYNNYSIDANLVMATMSIETFVENYKPDIVISIGGQTGDYPLYHMLSRPESRMVEHWRVANDGKIVDTYDILTKVFHCSEKYFFNYFFNGQKREHYYYKKWKAFIKNIDRSIELPFSNASIAQYLSNKIPKDSIIQFSILNSLRVWSFFELDKSIHCYSNVGAFGIDGGMSTLIGQSILTEKLCFMVIGDLAFFYDMNALGIRHIKNNLRILLINNNGGVEFKLNGNVTENKQKDKYIAAGNHFRNAEGWANTCDFLYLSAQNMDEFVNNSEIFLMESKKSIVFEVFISDVDEMIAYKNIIDCNLEKTVKNSLKKIAKSILGN